MTYLEHVIELRNRILIVTIATLLFSVIGYYLYPQLLQLITPLINEDLYTTKITEGFTTRLSSSLLVGVCLSVPILIFNVCLFIFPALKAKRKVIISSFFILITTLFIFGTYYAFKAILPLSINFLKSELFYPQNVDRLISYKQFLDFIVKFLVAFGICFETPVIIFSLMKLEIISRKFLLQKFKYFILISFGVSAILTPPDIISQTLLACPMIILYLLCLLVAKILKVG